MAEKVVALDLAGSSYWKPSALLAFDEPTLEMVSQYGYLWDQCVRMIVDIS